MIGSFSNHSAASLLPALILVVGLGAVGWNGYQDWSLNGQSSDNLPSPRAQQPVAKQLSIQQLSSGNFFGQANSSAPAPQPKITDAPETRLRLVLQGAFSNSLVDNGRALIAEQGKKAKYYRVGDQLPGGATLSRVEAEHVVLSRAGRLETLSFSSQKNRSNKNQSQVASNRSVTPPAASADRNQGPQENDYDEPQRDKQQTASIKERLKRLREAQALSDIQ